MRPTIRGFAGSERSWRNSPHSTRYTVTGIKKVPRLAYEIVQLEEVGPP
jgi:hypothetical protein